MRLRDALKIFIGEYSKATTRRAYTQVLEAFVTEMGPGREVDQVRAAEIITFINDVRDKNLSPYTLQKYIKALKRFFKRLEELGEIKESPARVLRQKRLAPKVGKDKAATDNEVELILKVCFGDARNYALVYFIADTGCRAGGAATLRLSDLDLGNLTAKVVEKGDKARPVWYSSECAHALKLWIVERPPVPGDYVFCTYEGQPLSSAAVSQIIRRAAIRAGVRSMGSHALRHRKGHQLADSGVAITVAAAALGHSDSRITADFYYPHDLDRAEAAIRATHHEPEPRSNITQLFPKVK